MSRELAKASTSIRLRSGQRANSTCAAPSVLATRPAGYEEIDYVVEIMGDGSRAIQRSTERTLRLTQLLQHQSADPRNGTLKVGRCPETETNNEFACRPAASVAWPNLRTPTLQKGYHEGTRCYYQLRGFRPEFGCWPSEPCWSHPLQADAMCLENNVEPLAVRSSAWLSRCGRKRHRRDEPYRPIGTTYPFPGRTLPLPSPAGAPGISAPRNSLDET
jgi:hypothetical protein